MSVTLFIFAACFSPLAAQTPGETKMHPYHQRIIEMDRLLSSVRPVSGANLSPDGREVAWAAGGVIRVAPVEEESAPQRVGAASSKECNEQAPTWSPDGGRLAFLSDCSTPGQLEIFVAKAPGFEAARQVTHLTGSVAGLRWSPDGSQIAFLFVNHASRAPSPMAAIKAPTGVIDDQAASEVQRIAICDAESGATRIFSPPSLYAFEFDWSPDSRKLVYTAAAPPGDDNWYFPQLYTQALTESGGQSLYQPKLQIALPRWSPSGKSIAFIEGLMSDEGATGGEIYLLDSTGGTPRNLTPGRRSTPSWFTWRSETSLLFTEFEGGSSAIALLDVATQGTKKLWEGGETIQAGPEATSLSVAKGGDSEKPVLALIRRSWAAPGEVWAGPVGNWQQISHENEHIKTGAIRGESVSWQNDSFEVQGWLVFPSNFDPSKHYPMIVSIHGGPAWIFTPRWPATDFDLTALTDLGYFIFFPNPRGSFGQGERFTQANRRDWGFGDLSDVTSGVDAVLKKEPVDSKRVGILGWSYGGSTSLFAVTRTSRFRAAVAGASACNLQSYYGENSIDKWMLPYFGASVYDDPAAYLRNSALTYVKQAKTPTLLLVGELDGEAPPAQSFEFWHALKTMRVPTQLVVYPGEGHAFSRHEDRVDLVERTLEWFMRFMPPD